MNTTFQHANPTKISISLADECDREVIYTIHHGIYARELGQHIENHSGRLTDKLDVINIYIVAKIGDQIAGFVSITPPSGYSIDKFFAQEELPLTFDHRLF